MAEERREAWVWPVVAEPAAVRRVRRVVTVECRERGLSADLIDSVVLAVDELAANALRYGAFEVRIYERPLVLAVADASPEATVVHEHLRGGVVAGPNDERGRGLSIVAALFPEHTITATTLTSGWTGKEIRLTVGEGEAEGSDDRRERAATGSATRRRGDRTEAVEAANRRDGSSGRPAGEAGGVVGERA